MKRPSSQLRRHGFDVLVVLAAIGAALEVALRNDPGDEPTTTLWFTVPAVAAAVLTLLGWRRFPFWAAAAFWISCAALSSSTAG